MFESNTYESILDRMLSNMPYDIDKRQGSIAWDMVSPVAIELARENVDKDLLLSWVFAGEDMPSEYLDLRVSEVGLSRKENETDSELLNRYFEWIRNPSSSGNVWDYIKWAKEVTGVGQAIVLPIWDGNGTVKVIISNSDNGVPDENLISSCSDYIETKRPIGASVTVVGCVALPINISFTVELINGYSSEQVQEEFTVKITQHFKDISFNESVVRFTNIGSMILDCAGVIDYSNLTINEGTGNIVIETGQIPTTGTVTVS